MALTKIHRTLDNFFYWGAYSPLGPMCRLTIKDLSGPPHHRAQDSAAGCLPPTTDLLLTENVLTEQTKINSD